MTFDPIPEVKPPMTSWVVRAGLFGTVLAPLLVWHASHGRPDWRSLAAMATAALVLGLVGEREYARSAREPEHYRPEAARLLLWANVVILIPIIVLLALTFHEMLDQPPRITDTPT